MTRERAERTRAPRVQSPNSKLLDIDRRYKRNKAERIAIDKELADHVKEHGTTHVVIDGSIKKYTTIKTHDNAVRMAEGTPIYRSVEAKAYELIVTHSNNKPK